MNVKELKHYLESLPDNSTVETYRLDEDGYGYYDELRYDELRIDDGKPKPEMTNYGDLPF